MQQIRVMNVGASEEQDSEIMLNVPQEVMSGQTGIQNARVTRGDNNHRGRHHQHSRDAKVQSAKTVGAAGKD